MDEINMYVNLVESSKTQIPFNYYDFPYCRPPYSMIKARTPKANLGDKLQGGTEQLLPYTVEALNVENCQVLCKKTLKAGATKKFIHLIDDDYRIHFQLDGLPVIMRAATLSYAVRGFPVGFVAPNSLTGVGDKSADSVSHFLYNHVRVLIRYNQDPISEQLQIVGFDIVPFSIKHIYEDKDMEVKDPISGEKHVNENVKLRTCTEERPAVNDPSNFMLLDAKAENTDILFTYDIDWIPSSTTWENRWDIYFSGNPDDEIHIFSIVNSLMIILFLSAVVATILLRTLHKEIAEYNELSTLEEAQEESGWKLVHADVFRPPKTSPVLLSILIGTGVQIGFAISFICLVALTGHFDPTDKGSCLNTVILLYVFCGSAGGYFSARVYKLLGGKEWKKNTVGTSVFFPGVLVSMFLVLDVMLMTKGAATAVSFGTVFAVFLLWVGVSTPLMFLGSYFGFRKETVKVPLKVTQIARHIPEQSLLASPLLMVLTGGILPFGSVCIELFFIMSSLWLSQLYYVFGFLFAVVVILIITCSEISIVLVYFQLCNEDYRWWWRSFLSCASSGLYLFLYSTWYLSSKLEIEGFVSVSVYLTYNAMIAMAFGLFTGAIGFFSALIFVKKIYGALKVD